MTALRLRDATAATLVEVALASTLFITITFGTIEVGRMILDYNVLSDAARAGVRYGIVRGASSGRAASAVEVATYVAGRSAGLLSASDVTVSWPTNNATGSVIQVQVQYSFTPIITLLPQTGINLTSTTSGYILR